jgi:hypothetical protein
MVESVQADHHDSQQSDAHEGFNNGSDESGVTLTCRPSVLRKSPCLPKLELLARNIFLPLWIADMELKSTEDKVTGQMASSRRPVAREAGHLPSYLHLQLT